MIKQLTIITAIVFASNYCFAQIPSEFNWQDFVNSVKNTHIAAPVKTGEFTIFKIVDINKFLYKVEIAGKVFELQTPIPTELQTLFRLTPQQLAQRENDNKVKDAATATDKEGSKMKAVVNDLTVQKNLKQNKVLLTTMNTLVENCDLYYTKSAVLGNDVFKLKSTRNKLVLIAQSDKAFKIINGMLSEVNLPDPEEIRNRYTALKAVYAKVEDSYNEAKAQAQKVVEEAANKFQQDSSANNNNTLENANNNLKKIEEASKGIEKAEELIEEEALLALIDDVDFLYKEIGDKNNFTVVSPPVQMDGDMVSYIVNITPCVTRKLGPNRSPMQFKFDIPAKKGLKVDFGVGPAFSFGSNAKDDKYFLANVDADGRGLGADSVKLTKLKNNNAISPGLVAMMHIYARSGKLVSWGGTFGVGAGFQNTTDVNLSIYSGLCFVFGKREKVILSSGVSWLKIERRKEDRYKALGDRFKLADINLAEATEKVFKPSFFIGITYSLTNKVEIK
jgi:hypothetical protein